MEYARWMMVRVLTAGAMALIATGAARASTFVQIYKFHGGTTPIQDILAVDSLGRLYGTSNDVPATGLLFVLTPPAVGASAWTEHDLYSFVQNEPYEGTFPQGGVTVTGSSILGTLAEGGTNGYGVTYRLNDRYAPVFMPLHEFQGQSVTPTDGAGPNGGLALGLHNLYYGATADGGGGGGGGLYDGLGTVYAISSSTASPYYAVLHRFGAAGDGAFPDRARLAVDPQGRLYGPTIAGGIAGEGAVFMMQVVNGAWQEQVLHSFSLTGDVFNPYGNVALDAQGNVYGCAQGGTASPQNGAVYQLAPPTTPGAPWVETIIYNFVLGDPIVDSNSAFCNVTVDTATGRIFGTSSGGGDRSLGTIFELDPPSAGKTQWKEKVDHSFKGNVQDGARPQSPLLQVGGVYYGGNPSGVVFSFTP